MAPALAQGANTSFEDAYELQACLSMSSNLEDAFSRYEQRRIERTQIIQSRAAQAEMRYYEAISEASPRQSSPQASNDEFQDWLYNYQPSVSG
jgi:salicylate hydroxylase